MRMKKSLTVDSIEVNLPTYLMIEPRAPNVMLDDLFDLIKIQERRGSVIDLAKKPMFHTVQILDKDAPKILSDEDDGPAEIRRVLTK